jgi:hypothetical protein
MEDPKRTWRSGLGQSGQPPRRRGQGGNLPRPHRALGSGPIICTVCAAAISFVRTGEGCGP